MLTNEVLLRIRKNNNLSQDEMAEKLFVTRQAVSRWETGETIPNVDTLKLISKTFDVSINTLLGSPRNLTCQCCGMSLYDDEVISRERDQTFNEEYCKWCYIDGKIVYSSMQDLLDFLVSHMAIQYQKDEQEIKEMLLKLLPKLNLWKTNEVNDVKSQNER